jgi:hypothetical protein
MKNHYAGIFIATAVLVIAACSMPLEGVGVKPETPAAPALTAGNGSLTASWSADRAESYRVYLGTTAAVPPEPSYTGTGNSTVFTGLENEVTYYVWVQAVNAAGTSALSEPASKTLTLSAPSPVLTAGNGSLTVTWAAADMAESYRVYLNTTAAVPPEPSYTGTELSTTFTGLGNWATYYVWVQAVNAGGSALSERVSISLPVPEAPLITAGDEQLTVTWAGIADADAYEVWKGTTNDSSAAAKYGGDIAGTSVTITGLTNGTGYYVWIKAKKGAVTSEFSRPASAAPRPPEIINIGYTGAWTLEGDGSRKSPIIGHDNTTKMRVNFTSTVPNTSITVLLKVSSELDGDYAFIGKLDNASATPGNCYPGSPISGTTSIPVTIPVPSAGNHFIDIGYSKDETVAFDSDCAWFMVIVAGPGETLNSTINNVRYAGTWNLEGDGSHKSPVIGHDNTTKTRVFFTSTVPTSITILLKVSSELDADYAFIGKLDDASTTPGNCYPGGVTSGTTSIPVTIPVPAAGNHFIDIGYSKDNTGSAGSDCAWFTLVP